MKTLNNCKIIATGDELLSGDTVNTNASNFSKILLEYGIVTEKQLVIRDDMETIVETIQNEMKNTGLIILTGGLGPTKDDITREAISEALGRKLIIDKASAKRIEDYFFDNDLAVEENYKQAYFPEGARVFSNSNGTADGFMLVAGGTTLLALPGPPGENLPIFKGNIQEILKDKEISPIITKFYRIFGIGEWETAARIRDLTEENPNIATYAKREGLFIKVPLTADKQYKFAFYEKEIQSRFGKSYLGEGIKTSELELVERLISENISVSTAESITGGMIASRLISIGGISQVLKESYVTYADETKEKILGVSPETIKKYGVVSEPTIVEMLDGLAEVSGSDLLIATSGYAGPTGEDVGLVYYGALYKGRYSIRWRKYSGDRERIRYRSASDAMLNAYGLITEKEP